MIDILERLPTLYLWLYIALAVAFLLQGMINLRKPAGTRNAFGGVVMALFVVALSAHLFHFFRRW